MDMHNAVDSTSSSNAGLPARSNGPLRRRSVNLLDSSQLDIIVALEREIRPLVQAKKNDWRPNRREFDGRSFTFFENNGVVAVCSGIGPEAARRAGEAVVSLYRPAVMVSAGFAGALDPTLSVGHTLTPRYIIDARDGSRIDCGSGDGVLVSFAEVADAGQKARLAQAYGAQAVDMEAAAIGRCAETHGLKFLACKAISDTRASSLPPIGRFVESSGRLHVFRFMAYAAARPWLWPKVFRLAVDSAIAAKELSSTLASNLESWSAPAFTHQYIESTNGSS
jgi:adenosylhomocysteine nucleosidase